MLVQILCSTQDSRSRGKPRAAPNNVALESRIHSISRSDGYSESGPRDGKEVVRQIRRKAASLAREEGGG